LHVISHYFSNSVLSRLRTAARSRKRQQGIATAFALAGGVGGKPSSQSSLAAKGSQGKPFVAHAQQLTAIGVETRAGRIARSRRCFPAENQCFR